jgi:hypothetical protein
MSAACAPIENSDAPKPATKTTLRESTSSPALPGAFPIQMCWGMSIHPGRVRAQTASIVDLQAASASLTITLLIWLEDFSIARVRAIAGSWITSLYNEPPGWLVEGNCSPTPLHTIHRGQF